MNIFVRECLSWMTTQYKGHNPSGAEHLENPQYKILAENIIGNFNEV